MYSKVGDLRDSSVSLHHLNFSLEFGSSEDFLFELHNVAIAQGFSLVADKTGLGRERLYKTLQPHAKPYFETVAKILRAMGFELQLVSAKNNVRKQPVTRFNTLMQVAPEIANEWHSLKNEGLSPNDVTPSSRKKVWWFCLQKHEWRAYVVSRIKGHGCPYCDAIKVLDNLKNQNLVIDKNFLIKSRKTGKMFSVNLFDKEHELEFAYFDPKVLTRYTSLSDHYRIEDDSIKCADFILPYYVNSKNEVCVYLYDLSLLPDLEVDYWRIHNLKYSHGDYPVLADKRDLYCEFDNSEKQELVFILKQLREVRTTEQDLAIWEPKEDFEQMSNEVVIPLIEDYRQYRDLFLLPLARLVIEGFSEKKLKEIAKLLKIELQDKEHGNKLGTLNILQKCLESLSDKEKAKSIIQPLKDLQKEKSAKSSHGGGMREGQVVAKAKDVLTSVTKSIAEIVKVFKNSSQQ